ncbi:MAG: T9SS type A sorting domain-containing protein [Bacteroidota bacterium]
MRTTLPPILASYLFRSCWILVLILGLSLSGLAQVWEQTYGVNGIESARDVHHTPDGGFIMVGSSTNYSTGNKDVLLIKNDVDGVELWSSRLGLSVTDETGSSLKRTPDGGYIVGGTQVINGISKMYLTKTDAFGVKEWAVTSSQDSVMGESVDLTPDGGYIVVGSQDNLYDDNQGDDIFAWKVDANGYEQWINSYGGEFSDKAFDVHVDTEGSLYILGTTYSFGNGGFDIYLVKTDFGGTELWSHTYGGEFTDIGHSLSLCSDSSFIITGVTNSNLILDGRVNAAELTGENAFLMKVDMDGNSEWLDVYPLDGPQKGWDVQQTADGGFILTGETRETEVSDRDLMLIRTDYRGVMQWNRTYGGSTGDVGYAVWADPNGGFAAAGETWSFGNGNSDVYLIRTDSLGNTLSSLLTGNVFNDLDLDCSSSTGDQNIPGWLVHASGANSYYATTDSLGNYAILADTGSYTINLVLPNEYWLPCQDSISVQLTSAHDTVWTDFAVQAEADCPALTIDISTPFLRRCSTNTYTVQYCNMGSVTAVDAIADVTLDPYITIDSSSLPLAHDRLPQHFFPLGDVAPFECGTFYIYTTLDCDSTFTGQTHCTEAHIYPDTLCQFTDSLWDGSSVVLDAACQGDSLVFTARNVGDSSMSIPSGFVIIEDDLMLRNGNILLPSGEDTSFVFFPNGQTMRMEANQSDGHPGFSYPSIAVEGCGYQPYNTGYVIQFPQNDADPFLDIDCRESISSFDPNDKLGFPKGYGDENYIRPETEIEYLIRFQNTGTDTAFRVAIRDTLSHMLDIETVSPGASSHPYTFEIRKGNILQFVFNNIFLPDSTTNEAESHGFVKFRIAQRPGNQHGEKIFNSAAIYFDFNAPIITPPTEHTIGINFILLANEEGANINASNNLKIFPNPFETEATIELTDNPRGQATFNLYNLTGRLIQREQFFGKQYQFKRKGLPAGAYFFEITVNEQQLGRGKIVLK